MYKRIFTKEQGLIQSVPNIVIRFLVASIARRWSSGDTSLIPASMLGLVPEKGYGLEALELN